MECPLGSLALQDGKLELCLFAGTFLSLAAERGGQKHKSSLLDSEYRDNSRDVIDPNRASLMKQMG